MNLADWSIEAAIIERVRQEDLAMWGSQPTPNFNPIPPMPFKKWRNPPLKAFLSSIKP